MAYYRTFPICNMTSKFGLGFVNLSFLKKMNHIMVFIFYFDFSLKK